MAAHSCPSKPLSKSKILDGIEAAADYARVERVIRDWIREDVPIAGKMNLTPEHVAKLVDRICGSRTRIVRREGE